MAGADDSEEDVEKVGKGITIFGNVSESPGVVAGCGVNEMDNEERNNGVFVMPVPR